MGHVSCFAAIVLLIDSRSAVVSSTTSTTTVTEPMRITTTTTTTFHSPIRPQRTRVPASAERPPDSPGASSRSSVGGQSAFSYVSTAGYKAKKPQQPFKKPLSSPDSPGLPRAANASASANARPPEPRQPRVPHPNELARPPTTRGNVKTYVVIVGQDVGLFFTWYAPFSLYFESFQLTTSKENSRAVSQEYQQLPPQILQDLV